MVYSLQSGLELYMYKALKEAEIVAEYEPTSYTCNGRV